MERNRRGLRLSNLGDLHGVLGRGTAVVMLIVPSDGEYDSTVVVRWLRDTAVAFPDLVSLVEVRECDISDDIKGMIDFKGSPSVRTFYGGVMVFGCDDIGNVDCVMEIVDLTVAIGNGIGLDFRDRRAG